MSEHDEQRALFGWAKHFETQYPQLVGLFAVPNGGKRDVVTAMRLKYEGVKKGVPDIMLPAPVGRYHGCFLELKVGNNRPTPEQVGWISHLSAQGYACFVAYGWEHASKMILAYLQGESVESIVAQHPRPRPASKAPAATARRTRQPATPLLDPEPPL